MVDEGKSWVEKPGSIKGQQVSIRHYQKEYGLICSKIVCTHLFREICQDEKEGLHWQAGAITALQEGFEDYLVELFSDCILEAIHGCRVTVMPKDIFITCQIRGETDKYNGPGSISLRDIPSLANQGLGLVQVIVSQRNLRTKRKGGMKIMIEMETPSIKVALRSKK